MQYSFTNSYVQYYLENIFRLGLPKIVLRNRIYIHSMITLKNLTHTIVIQTATKSFIYMIVVERYKDKD